jgi:hypothetical protein
MLPEANYEHVTSQKETLNYAGDGWVQGHRKTAQSSVNEVPTPFTACYKSRLPTYHRHQTKLNI